MIINLLVAETAVSGRVGPCDIADTRLCTTDSEIAERRRAAGHTVTEAEIEPDTRERICFVYVRGYAHLLKIDVQGGTRSMAGGLAINHVRSWIILAEATRLTSEAPDFAEWEKQITDQDYNFVYYGGLSRFYAADERPPITVFFQCPLNVWEDFSTAAIEAALLRAQQTESARGWRRIAARATQRHH